MNGDMTPDRLAEIEARCRPGDEETMDLCAALREAWMDKAGLRSDVKRMEDAWRIAVNRAETAERKHGSAVDTLVKIESLRQTTERECDEWKKWLAAMLRVLEEFDRLATAAQARAEGK